MLLLSSIYLIDSLTVLERKINCPQNIFLCSAVLILVIFLFVKLNFKGYLKQLFVNVFSGRVYTIFVDKNEKSSLFASRLINVASIISIGASVSAIIVYGNSNVCDFDSFRTIKLLFISTGIVALLFFLSYLILSALGGILKIKELAKNYFFLKSDIYKIVAIIFFPLFLLLILWSEYVYNMLFVSMLVFLALSLLLRTYIFFYYSFKIKFLNHYSILYFCTFEIIPILFLVYYIGKL